MTAMPAREPLFFGPTERTLFGVHQDARGATNRPCGVVLCPAIGQEYMRAHRAFSRLADQLSDSGYYSLRFDYFGCGDSAGDDADWSLNGWLDDIQQAAELLRDGTGVPDVCLLGLRIGASLALKATEKAGATNVIAWEPVIEGATHLQALERQHLTWQRGSFVSAKRVLGPNREVLGFRLNELVVSEIQRLDLSDPDTPLPRRLMVVDNGYGPGTADWCAKLTLRSPEVTHLHLPAQEVWHKDIDAIDQGLVPSDVLNAIVSWLDGIYA